ncbi:MAG: nicotinate-nucleotide diphosphorylase (carboxylating) [Candidatus Bathyarchaeum sp.]|nr:MAG: nicotinate-nucleotide diphosphorylase (carboxylating) [Candidatus Bathyarchaeum sp.]
MWLEIVDRQKFVELAYQRGNELNLSNKNYRVYVETFFEKEYQDDVGCGDVTSNSVLTKNEFRSAFLIIKTDGVISGLEEVCWFLRKHGLTVTFYTKDGSDVEKGETVLKLGGGQKDILATERIALNVLQRMSGIATETKRLTHLLKDYNTRIAATRKTLLRYFDKKAVFFGGGLTHRFGLWDSVLIKDNHLEALKQEGIVDYIESAIAKASVFADQVDFIELEVTTIEEAVKAARKFKELQLKTPCVIMLDNMKPAEIKQTLETLRDLSLYDNLLFEASGDITTDNILEYAKTGIDVISLGYLTHSVCVLDMSLEMAL